MAQTLLALCALACVSLLMLNTRRLSSDHRADGYETDVESRLNAVASNLLDAGEALPYIGAGSAGSSGVPLGFPAAIDDWNGFATTVSVPDLEGTLTVQASATVEPVVKQAGALVAGTADSPMRLVTVRLIGPLGTQVELSRLYARIL